MSKRNGKVTAFTKQKPPAPGNKTKTDATFKAGVPHHGVVKQTTVAMANQRPAPSNARSATQGQSTANSGDQTPVGGHNAPRGGQYTPPGGKRTGAVTSKITPTTY